MSSGDSISKSFGDVPKLLGKENYVRWRQRITLALSLTRSSSFVLPSATFPYPVVSSNLYFRSIKLGQMQTGSIGIIELLLPSFPPQMSQSLTAHIHLLDVEAGRAQAVFSSLSGSIAILVLSIRLRSDGSSSTISARMERMWRHG